MSGLPSRVFDTAFKQALMLRLAAGETLAGLSRETGIRRKSLYEWRNAYRKLGVAGLNRKRGRQPGWNLKGKEPSGRQQVDLDFFQKALRLMDAKGTPVSTAAKSTRSSKP